MTEFTNPSVPHANQKTSKIGKPVSLPSAPADSAFLARMVAMAGHDLRQPLQLITDVHDGLATLRLSGKQQRQLVQAANVTAQLARMLGQLVGALQLYERPREGFRRPVLVRPILDDLTAEFDEPARRKGITFRVACTGGAALSHPLLLASILRNLIRNAIDYTPPDGSVFVSSHRRDPELCIYVRDTGIGIRPKALSTIFGASERADESRANGLELGFSIAKRAADLLGHRIEVRSAEGRGSVLTVKIPALSTRWSPARKSEPLDRPDTGSDLGCDHAHAVAPWQGRLLIDSPIVEGGWAAAAWTDGALNKAPSFGQHECKAAPNALPDHSGW